VEFLDRKDIDREGAIIKFGLERVEQDLITKGLLNNRKLNLKNIRFGELLQKVYNNTFKAYKNKSQYVGDEDFSNIILNLFLSEDYITLRSEIKNLGYGFKTIKKPTRGYEIVDIEGKAIPITKTESIILRYNEKDPLHNYLIGVISNAILNFLKTSKNKSSKNLHLDMDSEEGSINLKDILNEKGLGGEDVEYTQLKKAVIEKARDNFKEDFEISPPLLWFESIYTYIGEFNFAIKEVSTLLGDTGEIVSTIWGYIEESYICIVEEGVLDQDPQKLRDYLEGSPKKKLGHKKLSSKATNDLEELLIQVIEIEGNVEVVNDLRASLPHMKKLVRV
jgi:hypothetical protein